MTTHLNHKRRTVWLLASLAAVLGLLLALPRPAAAAGNLPGTCASPCSVDLYATAGTTVLPDSTSTTVWGFTSTGAAPTAPGGPTIVVSQGASLSITLHNTLSENVALAFPQMSGAPDTVGAPAAGTHVYGSVDTSRPGTYLYEAGNRDQARHQVAMGLYGAIVVLPSGPSAYDDDSVLLLSEIDPALNGSASPASFDMQNYKPKYWLINGTAYPATDPIPTASGNDVRLRYVNAGLTDHSMGVLNLHQRIVANDSHPLGTLAYDAYAETVAPGQTLDAAVTIPASAAGDARYSIFDQGQHLDNNGANWKVTNGTAGRLSFGGMLTFLTTATGGCGGPTASNPGATPAGSDFDIQVTFTACAGRTLAGAEYLVDTTLGTPTSLTATGSSATLNFSVSPVTPGLHTVYVRATDSASDVSPWVPITFTVAAGDITGPATTAFAQVITHTGNTTTGSTTVYSLPTTADLAFGMSVSGAGIPAGATITGFGGSLTRTGTTGNGSALVTGLSTTTDLSAGMPVSGTGVPAGTKIASIGGAITRNGTTTNGSTAITGLSSTTGLSAGMPVTATTGVPAGATLTDLPGATTSRSGTRRTSSTVITGLSSTSDLAVGLQVGGIPGISGTRTIAAMPGATLNRNGTRTSGSPIITGLSSTADLEVGMTVSRPAGGIPAGTTIIAINSGSSVTMSNNATSSGGQSLTFTLASGQIRISGSGTGAGGTASLTFTLLAGQVRISAAATASGSRSLSFHTSTATTLTLTNNATASGTVPLTFTTAAGTSIQISPAATATAANVPLAFDSPITTGGALTITPTANDTATGGSDIAGAEYWIDGGAHIAMSAADGTFNSPIEGLTATITGLSEGAHTLSVRSQDDAGNWGPAVTVGLRVDKTGPGTTGVTIFPNPNNGTLSRDPNVLEVQVDANVADVTAAGISSVIKAAEGVFDNPAFAPGSGVAFVPADGAFDSSSEAVYLRIPLSQINALTQGPHVFYVRGKDAAGNWGPSASTTMTFAKTGPGVTAAAVNLQTQTVTATATDAASNVTAAEWFVATDPGVGNGTAMQAADGSFNSQSEQLTASLSSLTPGIHTVSIRAKDAAGNWGAVSTVTYDKLFASTFSNSAGTGVLNPLNGTGLNQWSLRSPTTGSSLSSTTGGLAGGDCCKLTVALGGTTARYVQDSNPTGETSYRARLYLNPNSAVPVSATDWTTIFIGRNSTGQAVFSVQLQHNAAATYLLRLQALNGTGTGTTLTSATTSIPNATATRIEIAWLRSPLASPATGSLRLWVNGGGIEPVSPTLSITAINNSTRTIEDVRLGPSLGLPSSTPASGQSMLFDQFVSTHNTYVGP